MTQTPDRTRMRVAFLATVFVSLMTALVLRLWSIQVLAPGEYLEAAERNKIRLVQIEPARGKILDRNGEILVRNTTSNVVAVRLDQVEDRPRLVQRLSEVLSVPPQQIEQRLSNKRIAPFTPVPVAEGVPEETIIYLREHADEFSGVVPEVKPIRVYPQGPMAAHALGYVGEINPEQLEEPRYKGRGYRPGSEVGKGGIEQAYEHDLHGKQGLAKLVVDSRGNVVRQLGATRQPQPGNDLFTSLDSKVQALTEEALAQGIANARTVFDNESQKRYVASAGGAVVMDPRNGEVLAMASFPAYDPASFVGGISPETFAALNSDPANPLLNRVTQAALPPGSTFKIVTAAAALQEGIAQRNGRYSCPPSFRYSDTTFRNWKTSDSGAISVPQSIIESCDTVFYQWAVEFYKRFVDGRQEQLQKYAREFGFGARTGFELGGQAGRVPDEEWLKTVHTKFPRQFPHSKWLPGYTINMSIGQGDVLASPLQLASSYAVIANGGRLIQPKIGLKVADGERDVRSIPSREIRQVAVSPANLEIIKRGLEAVATDGTAQEAFAGFPFGKVSVASKTGTAELQQIPPKQPFAWFVAYAPAKDPRYVVAVMLEEGGHGGETAAPVARRIIEGLFGLPLSNIAPAARTD